MRAAVLLALAACGDNVEPDPNLARSGARLALVHYDYGEGARETDTTWFHDAARDERCTPRVWSDGVTHCTPAFGAIVFPTSECTTALGRVPIGAPVPAYFVTEYVLAGTPVPSKLFERGEPAAAPAQAWELRNGACLGPLDVIGYDYVAAGDEVPRDAFARITHPEARTTSRLALRVIASDDGLYAPIGLQDRDVELPCTPVAAPGEATTVCLPDAVATTQYFHDATCAEPELAVAVGESLPAVIRHHDARTSCTSYHAVGSEVDAPPLFHLNGPSCVAIAAPSSNRYYLAGAPRELGALVRDRDATPRRLHPITLAHHDLRISDGLLYDDVLATECRREQLDGALRCVPATSTDVIELFADAACQTVVPLAEVHTGTCAVPPAFARELHPIGSVHAAPLFHLSTGDRCLPYAIPEGIALHDVDSALPASAFAEAMIVIDD